MGENKAIKGGGQSASGRSAGLARAVAAVRRRVWRPVWRRVRPCLATADRCLRRIAGPSRFLSSAYYALFSRAFGREHRGVLAGRKRFGEETARPSGSSTFLRRSTHRLEKGLLMRPRRDVFGLDYIGEMVACYEQALETDAGTDCGNGDELRWAHDVLAMYFDVTASHPKIDPLRKRFATLPLPTGVADERLVPYTRDLETPPPVAYGDLLELSILRRSVRWFLPKPVPREMIDQAMAVAALSPSACNRQPFVFRVFDEPELVRRVAELPYGTAGYSENIPAIVVVVGRLRAYSDERDRHLIYVDGSLASMSFIYGAESLGLGTCCINWPDVEEREREMDSVLRLERDERPVMLIAVGYPDPEGMVARSQKKPLDQLRRYNFK